MRDDPYQKRLDQIERRLSRLEESAQSTMSLCAEIRVSLMRLTDRRNERLDRIEAGLEALRQHVPGIPAEMLKSLQRRQWATRR